MTITSSPNGTVAQVTTTDESTIIGLTLVCGDSPVSDHLGSMNADDDSWQIEVVEGLCDNSDRILDAVSDHPCNRLVLALCQDSYSKTVVRQRARRAGVGVFANLIVEIPAAGNESANKAVAITAVRSGMARIGSQKESKPENAKTSFASNSEKISRRALFTIPPIEYRVIPTVDKTLCMAGAGCSQCETACPHDAIKNAAGNAIVDTNACKSCGLCVTACPQRAIEFPGYSPNEIEQHVSTILEYSDGIAANVAFACEKSVTVPIDDWQIVPVACAAMVPASALLGAITAGAGSVGILRCVEQCSQRSSDKVTGRTDYARKVLENAGLDSSRIVDMAPADTGVSLETPAAIAAIAVRQGSLEFFGTTAAANSILGIESLSSGSVSPFVHPLAPVGIPVIDQEACTMCGTCSLGCPTDALRQEDNDGQAVLTFDASKCVACGECASNCPEAENGAIRLELITNVSALNTGAVELNVDGSVTCERCKANFTSTRTLKRLETLLGEDYSHELYGTHCPECRAFV